MDVIFISQVTIYGSAVKVKDVLYRELVPWLAIRASGRVSEKPTSPLS